MVAHPAGTECMGELADFVVLLIALMTTGRCGFHHCCFIKWKNDNLPESIESIIVNGLKTKNEVPNKLIAVATLVDNRYRGQNLSAEILETNEKLGEASWSSRSSCPGSTDMESTLSASEY